MTASERNNTVLEVVKTASAADLGQGALGAGSWWLGPAGWAIPAATGAAGDLASGETTPTQTVGRAVMRAGAVPAGAVMGAVPGTVAGLLTPLLYQKHRTSMNTGLDKLRGLLSRVTGKTDLPQVGLRAIKQKKLLPIAALMSAGGMLAGGTAGAGLASGYTNAMLNRRAGGDINDSGGLVTALFGETKQASALDKALLLLSAGYGGVSGHDMASSEVKPGEEKTLWGKVAPVLGTGAGFIGGGIGNFLGAEAPTPRFLRGRLRPLGAIARMIGGGLLGTELAKLPSRMSLGERLFGPQTVDLPHHGLAAALFGETKQASVHNELALQVACGPVIDATTGRMVKRADVGATISGLLPGIGPALYGYSIGKGAYPHDIYSDVVGTDAMIGMGVPSAFGALGGRIAGDILSRGRGLPGLAGMLAGSVLGANMGYDNVVKPGWLTGLDSALPAAKMQPAI